MFAKMKTGTGCFKKTQIFFCKELVIFIFVLQPFIYNSVKSYLILIFFFCSYFDWLSAGTWGWRKVGLIGMGHVRKVDLQYGLIMSGLNIKFSSPGV